jgi:hypothetical protein
MMKTLFVSGAPHIASQSGAFCAGVPADTLVDTEKTMSSSKSAAVEPKKTLDYGDGSGGSPTESQKYWPPYWTDAQPRDSMSPLAKPTSPEMPPSEKPSGSNPAVPTPAAVGTGLSAPVTPTQPETTEPGSPVGVKRSGGLSPGYWKYLSFTKE